MTNVGRGLTRTLTPAALAVGVALKKSFDEWDAGYDAIRAGTGATGKALEGLGDSMKSVGGKVTQPLSEVGQVIADISTRTGATGPVLEGLSKQILDLSRITGTEAVPNVAAATRVFGDWSIASKDQAGHLDMLFRASQNTGIGITTLMERVVQFGAPMRELGFSFAETASLLGSFEKAGVNSKLVMGGLKQGLGRLAKAGKDPRKEIDQLSASIEKAGLTAENKEKVFEIFGARAGIDMAKAIEEGRFKLGDLITTVEAGSETITKASDDTLDFGDKLKMLGNKAMGALGPFGEVGAFVAGGLASIGPALMGIGAVAPQLGKVGKAFGGLGSAIGKGAKGIGSVAASVGSATGSVIASGARMAVGVAVSAATTIASWVATAAAAVASAATVVASWLVAAAPFILIAAVVAGVAFLIIKHWDTIKAALLATWNFIKTAAGVIFNALKTIFLNFTPVGLIINHWNTIKSVLASIWNAIKAVSMAVFNAIRAYFTTIFNVYKTIITTAINAIRAVITGVWNSIRSVTSSIWNGIKAVISGAANGIRSVVTSVANTVKSVLTGAWNAITSGARAAWNAITGAFQSAYNKIAGIVRKIKDTFCNLPFVPCSPIPLVVDAESAVDGVLGHFKTLQRKLPSVTSGIGIDMPTPGRAHLSAVAAGGGHSRVVSISVPVTIQGNASAADASHISAEVVRRVREELLKTQSRTGRLFAEAS